MKLESKDLRIWGMSQPHLNPLSHNHAPSSSPAWAAGKDSAGFLYLNSGLRCMGKAAQGGVCRFCTMKILSPPIKSLGRQVHRKSSVLLVVLSHCFIIDVFPTYVSIPLGWEKQAISWCCPSSLRLLFFPIPAAGRIRLGLLSPCAASVSAQNPTQGSSDT